MTPDLKIGGHYSELAISAINLNAESQAPEKSSLSYYRLFRSGKPVSEFYCKACEKRLGPIAPTKYDRYGPFTATLGSMERRCVLFAQRANGIVVGEYLVSEI